MMQYSTVSRGLCLFVAIGLLLVSAATALAGAPIAGYDAILHEKQFAGHVQFGSFLGGGVTFNGLSSFTIDAQDSGDPNLGAFGGIGGHYLGEFGPTFDPNDYQLELTYKPLSNNVADKVFVVLTQHDGNDGPGPAAEAYGFRFENIDLGDPNNFTTLTRELVPFGVSDSYQTVSSPGWVDPINPNFPFFTANGNAVQDYNATKGGTPNGLYELEIQSIFQSALRLNIEVQSIKLVPKPSVGETEVARLDGNSGTTFGYGPLDGAVTRNGNVMEIDATATLNNQVGGSAIRIPLTNFDGTTRAVEVTAKLGPNNTANNLAVILKETDGDDDAAGQGGEEWGFFYNTGDSNFFDSNGFTTISIPISDGLFIQQPADFTFGGDGSVTDTDPNTADFGLYEMQVFSFFPTAGTVLDIDIQSVRIVDFVDSADFDFDGDVDGDDFLTWQQNAGLNDGTGKLTNGDANNDGNIDGLDLAIWNSQYGTTALTAAVSSSGTVPEPGSVVLLVIGLSCLAGRRSTRKRIR